MLARFGESDEALEITRQRVAASQWRRKFLLYWPEFWYARKDPRFRALAEKAPL